MKRLISFLVAILASLLLVCTASAQAQGTTAVSPVKIPTYTGPSGRGLHTSSSATQNEYLGGGSSSSFSRGTSSFGGSALHPVGSASVAPISATSTSSGMASAPYSESSTTTTPVLRSMGDEDTDTDGEHEDHDDPNADATPIGDGMAIMLLLVLAYFAKNIASAIARMQKK